MCRVISEFGVLCFLFVELLLGPRAWSLSGRGSVKEYPKLYFCFPKVKCTSVPLCKCDISVDSYSGSAQSRHIFFF